MAQDINLSTRASAAFVGFSTRFQMGFQQAPVFWPQVATEITSEGEAEIHAWLELIPGFRKWTDERKFHAIGAGEYTLVNDDWEDSFKLPRNKLEDDKIGLYGPNAEMLGMQARKFPDRLVADRLKNGHTSGAAYKCFDGKAFFATDHPKSVNGQVSGTFSNYHTSRALTAANFNTTYAELMAVQGPDGQPMALVPDALFVPPALRAAGKEIVEAGTVPNSAGTASQTNVNAGVVRLVVVPELAGADTTWYLGVTGMPIKPLIVQTRKAPEFDEIAGLDSPHCKLYKELLYGSDARAAFGYSFPHFMKKCVA
jgi:phage major head subunit gpT-like protein